MGGGIAQICAAAGYRVVLYDADPAALERAIEAAHARLQRQVERGELAAEDRAGALERLSAEPDLGSLAADIAIEAVPEIAAVKMDVLATLDDTLPAAAIIASNTSGLDIAELAAATRRPDRVIGMHFFNPPPSMPLVEVVHTPETSEKTVRAVWSLAEALGKTPISVANRPGFVVNRILIPMLNEAISALQEGAATAEDIDRAMTLGARHPLGPLALADFIGLDVVLHILESFEERLGDGRYRPCDLLRAMVSRGDLGRKTDRGFFVYD